MMNPRLPVMMLLLAGGSLAAQGVSRPVDLDAELDDFAHTDQIQAASKRVQDLASAPADVVVLRGSELKALGYRTLGDALGGVLGFRTSQDHAYQGMGSAGVYVLGDQNTRLLVLLDGHALNSPAEVGSSKVGEDFGIPLELVDHIEVVRGPASSLYGNNAFQALVNVTTVFASEGVSNHFQGAAEAGTGGMGEVWAEGAMVFPGVTANLMLSGFRRPGTARTFPELQPEALPREADREGRQSAYLHLKGHEWAFTGSMVSRVQNLASGPYGAVAGDTGNFYRNRRLAGEFKWEPHTEATHWMVRLFGDQNTFQDSFILDSDGSRDHATDQDPDRSLGVELQGRTLLAEHLNLTFGTEAQYHRYSGIYQSSLDGGSIGTDVAYGIGNTYVEANWQATPAWTFVGGLQRADWIPGRVRTLVDGIGQDQEKRSISRLTPRFSAIWRLSSGDVVKAIYGQGFRFPTLFERYYTDNASQVANPGIQPEVLTSTQLAWSRKWTSRLSTHLAASSFQAQHTIQLGAQEVDGATLQQFNNDGSSRKGKALEAETAFRQGDTEISGGAGWYDWTSRGATLDNLSQWNGVVKVIQRMGGLSLAGEARYLDGRRNASTGTSVPANWTLRASLRWEAPAYWVQSTLEDLTNSRRRDLVAPEYTPVTWMEGDGRAVRLVVGFRM